MKALLFTLALLVVGVTTMVYGFTRSGQVDEPVAQAGACDGGRCGLNQVFPEMPRPRLSRDRRSDGIPPPNNMDDLLLDAVKDAVETEAIPHSVIPDEYPDEYPDPVPDPAFYIPAAPEFELIKSYDFPLAGPLLTPSARREYARVWILRNSNTGKTYFVHDSRVVFTAAN